MYDFQIRPKDFSNYLFRSSSLHKLVGAYVNKVTSPALTEAQQRKYDELIAKTKLTAKQAETLSGLEARIDDHNNGNIEITQGAKTELIRIFRKECLGLDPFTDSTATARGTRDEDISIDLLNEAYNTNYTKNETKFAGLYTHGTPDIISNNIGDIKTAENFDTFERFNQTKADEYKWQLWDYKQNYIFNLLKDGGLKPGVEGYQEKYEELNDSIKTVIIRTLPSYPETEIFLQQEKRKKYALDNSKDNLNKISKQVYLNMNFDRIPANKRVKIFNVETFDGDSSIVYEYLEQCRKYLNGIVRSYFD